MAIHTALALDLGSSLGWCFSKGGVILQSGVENFVYKDAHPGDRFRRFHNWLAENWKGVTEIYYEDVPRFESAGAAKSYSGYLAFLKVFALLHNIQCRAIKPNTVKKLFTGKGNAPKLEVCRVAHALGWRHGFKSTDIDHDEADAIAVMWVILKKAGVEPAMYKRNPLEIPTMKDEENAETGLSDECPGMETAAPPGQD